MFPFLENLGRLQSAAAPFPRYNSMEAVHPWGVRRRMPRAASIPCSAAPEVSRERSSKGRGPPSPGRWYLQEAPSRPLSAEVHVNCCMSEKFPQWSLFFHLNRGLVPAPSSPTASRKPLCLSCSCRWAAMGGHADWETSAPGYALLPLPATSLLCPTPPSPFFLASILIGGQTGGSQALGPSRIPII